MDGLQINYNDKMLYEHLGLIIDEYERAAIGKATRNGFLATAHGPLAGMDNILHSAENVLKTSRDPDEEERVPPLPGEDTASNSQSIVSVNGEVTVERTGDNLADVNVLAGIELDADITDALGDELGGKVGEWLAECLNCDGRINFAWQLQPTNLLGPIEALLDDIELALGAFSEQINPFGLIGEFCHLMNGINFICIPDLVSMLMGLKLLLRKYMSFALDIRIDWTAVLGPIIKVILDGISGLMNMVTNVVGAPLECALGAVRTVHDLQYQAGQTVNAVRQLGERINDRGQQVVNTVGSILDGDPSFEPIDNERADAYFNWRLITTQTPDGGTPYLTARDSRTRPQQNDPDRQFDYPTGFRVFDDTRLPDALRDPTFLGADWTAKLTVAIQDAYNWIRELTSKLQRSISSVQELTAGGLSIQVGNLGLLVFVYDMISLIVNAIRLRRTNPNVSDWCQLIQDNPESVRPLLERSTSRQISLLTEDTDIALYSGPERIGVIPTCVDTRDPMIMRWINELKGNI